MALVLNTATTVQRTHSAVLSVADLCERALRKIGAYSINDTEADPEELQESMHWLDLVVAHLAGTRKCLWLIGGAVSVDLDADVSSYDLADAMGDGLPAGGVLFPISAYLSDENGNDTQIDILSRKQFNALPNKSQSGTPCAIYIDRLDAQTINVHPVPTVGTYTLKIDVQTYAPSMVQSKGESAHGFSAEWQLYMTMALATHIGDGPVRRLDSSTLARFSRQADGLLAELLAFSNRQFPGQDGPRRVKGWGV